MGGSALWPLFRKSAPIREMAPDPPLPFFVPLIGGYVMFDLG